MSERPKPPDKKTRKPEADRPKVVVAGSRTFTDYQLLRDKLDFYLQNLKDPIILHGGAEGADRLAARYAEWHWWTQWVFHPDYSKGPKFAPILRNTEMAVAGAQGPGKGALIAFWDGFSRGTAHMIETAREHGLIVKIVRFKCS